MPQKGGGKKKNPEKEGFQPVADMIISHKTDFEVLTADSLFGFMIIMDVVDNEISEYYGRSKHGFRINVPITKYLLKVSIIDVSQHYLEPIVLDRGRGQNKSSETILNFYREAQLQQRIWLESIVGGKQPICPDVYNVSYDCGALLFDGSRAPFKRRQCKRYPQVHDYLKNYHSRNTSEKIGVIVMEYIPNSIPLHRILSHPDIGDDIKEKAIITAGAQVIRLFMDHLIIHADLHGNNIIVDETGMSYIIDFGIILDLKDTTSIHIGRLAEANLFRDSKHAELNRAQSVRLKIITCSEIFDELERIVMDTVQYFQMYELVDAIKSRDLYLQVIEKYIELSSTIETRMSRKTIDSKIEKGEIELITDAGIGDAIIGQQQFIPPNTVIPSNPPNYIATILRSNATATVPINSASTAATVPIERTIGLSHLNNAIGITKKRKHRLTKRSKNRNKRNKNK